MLVRRLLASALSRPAAEWVAALVRRLGPRPPPPDPARGPSPLLAFDRHYGVETAGALSWRETQDGGEAAAYVTAYVGVEPDRLRTVLRAVGPDRSFTFIDLGSGKGTALIVASEFAFARIVGVELSPQLCAVAKRNAAEVGTRHPDRAPIEVVQSDVRDYVFPPAPSVLFMYHPFLAPVMKTVLANLERSLREHPRPVYIAYVNPELAWMIDRSSAFRRVTEEFILFEASASQRPIPRAGIWRSR